MYGESGAVVCQGAAPDEITVVPWGRVQSQSGEFLVDDAAADAIIANFKAHGADCVIDYEHQTLGGRYAAPNGMALAAGWITNLRKAPGVGIRGQVNWTPGGAAVVSGRSYRYLSPVLTARRTDGRAVVLHSVALTNTPAIAGMVPIVNSGSGVPDGYILVCCAPVPIVGTAAPGATSGRSQAGRTAAVNREAIIGRAGREWDNAASVQKLCGRVAFVNDALRTAKLTLLTADERDRHGVSVVVAANRDSLIRAWATEWDRDPKRLGRFCSGKATYVSGNLIAAGLPKLTDAERAAL